MNTSFVCFSVTITSGLRVCICLSVLISLSHGTLTLLFSTTAYGALDVICRDIKLQLGIGGQFQDRTNQSQAEQDTTDVTQEQNTTKVEGR